MAMLLPSTTDLPPLLSAASSRFSDDSGLLPLPHIWCSSTNKHNLRPRLFHAQLYRSGAAPSTITRLTRRPGQRPLYMRQHRQQYEHNSDSKHSKQQQQNDRQSLTTTSRSSGRCERRDASPSSFRVAPARSFEMVFQGISIWVSMSRPRPMRATAGRHSPPIHSRSRRQKGPPVIWVRAESSAFD